MPSKKSLVCSSRYHGGFLGMSIIIIGVIGSLIKTIIPEDSFTNLIALDPLASVIEKVGHIDVPSCARSSFITLHRDNDGPPSSTQDAGTCHGLLIRDDIILTSRECSKSNFTFDFGFPGINASGVGLLKAVGFIPAVPHELQNLNGVIVDPRIGFLIADPPYHYQSIDRKIRRNRVFLSLRDSPGIDGTAVAMSCWYGKPVAHNFPVNKELVPLAHLHAAIPYALWEHTDIQTAHTLEYKSQRWWDRGVTSEEEKKSTEMLLEKWKGPPGSVDVSTAYKEDFYENAAGVWEAEDPRGHRRNCWPNYYIRYREEVPFSGELFFDWLDFGLGRNVLEQNRTHDYMKLDETCGKSSFNTKFTYYFNDLDRLAYEVDIKPSNDGTKLIARLKQSGIFVPKSQKGHPFLYVQGLDGTFYVAGTHFKNDKLKHTSILAGRPALSAGKIYVGSNGEIAGINYLSGHYMPGIQSLSIMYQWMKNKSYNVTALHWVGRKSWSTNKCVEYDWTTIQLPGYDADTLNRSCHEVTKSPMWILKADV